MARWNITCKEFKKVRELITDDNKFNVNQILTELLKICNKYADEDKYEFAYEFQCLAEEIESVVDDEELETEDCDFYLSEFYDLCDSLRIWLEL